MVAKPLVPGRRKIECSAERDAGGGAGENAPVSTAPPPQRTSFFGDALRTMAVLLAIVGLVVGFQRLLSAPPSNPVHALDYRPALAAARAAAPFHVLAPSGLPDGWAATSVHYTPGSAAAWHLGVLTADRAYVGLEQSLDDTAAVLGEAAPGSVSDGTVEVAGDSWQLRRGPGNRTTLVRRVDGVTTVVTGDAPQDQLVAYAAGLR